MKVTLPHESVLDDITRLAVGGLGRNSRSSPPWPDAYTFGSDEPYLIVDGDRFIALGRTWRERDGSEHRFVMTGPGEITRAEWDEECREAGWPGHPGTWWDYLKDDVRAIFARIIG